MRGDVLLGEGLLDEQQVERVEAGEQRDVVGRVRRVRVDLEQPARAELLAHGPDRHEVPAGLDLELDAPVALLDVARDLVEELLEGRRDADRDAAVHPLPLGAEQLAHRAALRAQLGVEHGRLERPLRHPVARDERERRGHGCRERHGCAARARSLGRRRPGGIRSRVRPGRPGMPAVRAEERRAEVVLDDGCRTGDVLARVERVATGDALAPAVARIGDDVHEEHLAHGLAPEGGLERPDEGHLEAMQLDALDRGHDGGSSVVSVVSVIRPPGRGRRG